MSSARANGGRLTLEHWIALHDEMAALVRAGIPLNLGLHALGSDMSGGLGTLSLAVAARMERGEGLDEALAAESGTLGPMQRAIVKSGMRSGQLDSALEAVAQQARQALDMRRSLTLALLYPWVLLMLAWVLIALFAWQMVPRMYSAFAELAVPGVAFLATLEPFSRTAPYWGVAGLFILLLLGLGWMLSGRRVSWGHSGPRWLRRLPWTGQVIRDSQAATLSGTLATLVKHDVPLPEALELAAGLVDNTRDANELRGLAANIRMGWKGASVSVRGLPAMAVWMIRSRGDQASLVTSLEHAAATYHRRAETQAELLRRLLPLFLSTVLGGTVVLVYGLMLFVPFTRLLNQLAIAG